MFAILQYYVVKLVIKPIILNPVARRPVLPWQPFCTLLDGRVVLMWTP